MFPCELTEQPAQPTLTIRFHTPVAQLGQRVGEAYGRIMQYLGRSGEDIALMPFITYHNMDMQNLDVEAGFTLVHRMPGLSDIEAGEIAAGTFAICHYTGPYPELGQAYDTLTRFVSTRGYVAGETVYEFYLNGPETPPQDLKTDVVFPVTRAGEKTVV